jgi:hypothetical protein
VCTLHQVYCARYDIVVWNVLSNRLHKKKGVWRSRAQMRVSMSVKIQVNEVMTLRLDDL